MDESWRFHQVPPSICPTCSFSHFPFCRPPPSFFHPGVPHDDPMFPSHLPSLPLVREQQSVPIPWRGVQANTDRQAFEDELVQRESLLKRMRVDERGTGGWAQFPPPGMGRLGSEDERRLNLIRDHGQQQPRAQANGHVYSNDRFSHEGPGSQLGGYMNSDIDPLGRNGVASISKANGLPYCAELQSHRRLPMVMPIWQGFDKFVDREMGAISEIQQDGNNNSRFNVVGDKEYGSMQDRQRDFVGPLANGYRYDRAGLRASERHVVDQQHLEGSLQKGSWGQEPAYNSQQQDIKGAFHNEYPKHNERQQHLPPGPISSHVMTSTHTNICQAQVPLAVNADSHRQRDVGLVHPMKNAGEGIHQIRHHTGNLLQRSIENKCQNSEVGQFEAQEYPYEENSRIPSSIVANRYFPASSVDNVVASMSSQVNDMSSQPPLPSWHLHSSPSKVPLVSFEQNNISPLMHQKPAKQYVVESNSFPLQHSVTEKPKIIDASHIFKMPNRATRPGHIAIILRGLPGSGKSYLAKALRDLEVENGGNAPRVHSIDDYFMNEVEKVEGADGTKSSTPMKGKKPITKMVMEYCYEPEMEEAYRANMLKAFKKTVEEGIFTCVIVDDRNLRVADFAQFWAVGKSSGYEVYLLEATYKDPTGCAARNVHGFTLDDIQTMAEKWEEAPSLYLKLDIQPLFTGDKLKGESILEVDMDTEDVACDENVASEMQNEIEQATYLTSEGGRWAADEEYSDMNKLGSSKWSKNTDEVTVDRTECKDHSNALSGLLQAYGKSGKSVHWGDQVEKRGFSIGVAKHASLSSLIIGPGSGYNLNSNPISKDAADVDTGKEKTDALEKHSIFLEHLRTERESFRVLFDKRRQRIGGLYDANDD